MSGPKSHQSENGPGGLRPWELAEEIVDLRAENAELRNEIARLNNQTNWVCKCGGTDCDGQKENAVLREDKQRLDWLDLHISTQETSELLGLPYCKSHMIREAIDTARKEAQP